MFFFCLYFLINFCDNNLIFHFRLQQEMRYEDLYKIYKQRYAANIGNLWYLITPTHLVALDEKVSGAPYLSLTELTDCWTPSSDYSLIAAVSMARQLYRLPNDLALIHRNLIAIKHNDKVRVFWADTQEAIDDDRLLALEQVGSKPFRANATRDAGLKKIVDFLNHDWGALGNSIATMVTRPIVNNNVADLALELKTSQMVTAERLLFEQLYAKKMIVIENDQLTALAKHIKDSATINITKPPK